MQDEKVSPKFLLQPLLVAHIDRITADVPYVIPSRNRIAEKAVGEPSEANRSRHLAELDPARRDASMAIVLTLRGSNNGEPFYVTNRFSGTAMVCAVGIGCSPSYPQEARFNPPSHGTKLSN